MLDKPNSCNEQIIPSERSPRSFARLILIPPGNLPPTVATITVCPASTFGAPQTICTSSLSPIYIGESELVQIVCGAPNVDAGQTVIVATVGGRLPGGIKIKRAKLRGERSEGMICSLQELGLSSNLVPKAFEDGIYVFSTEVVPGTDALKALYLDDQVMEFDLLLA